jgi:ABC-type phosphate/phosphonate transport system permease subunit
MRRRSDWGQAVTALLLIMACSFFGTLAAGILLLLIFGGV